jgi:putative transposase
MPPVISALLACMAALFRSRASLHLEHLALRHQLAVYQQMIHRPCLRLPDRLFWVWLSRLWPGWQATLAFVQPRTVIAWQRQRLRDHWRRVSQQGKPGRPAVAKEVRALIRAMWQGNPTWGSPRIVGELWKVGIEVTKSTVEKYRIRPSMPPSPTWKTFLTNHVQDLVALDFFVVPTVRHTVLFALVILAPRAAAGGACQHHGTPDGAVDRSAGGGRLPMGRGPTLSAARSRPRLWRLLSATGATHGHRRRADRPTESLAESLRERLIGSIPRDCLDHVVVLHERHLRRLLNEYFRYYHHWRTHRALAMDCPVPRPVQRPERGLIWEVPDVGGLHHHYERRAA